jgi:hypothetical protein
MAAVSFSLDGVSEQDDIVAKKLVKQVETFGRSAETYGPIF